MLRRVVAVSKKLMAPAQLTATALQLGAASIAGGVITLAVSKRASLKSPSPILLASLGAGAAGQKWKFAVQVETEAF